MKTLIIILISCIPMLASAQTNTEQIQYSKGRIFYQNQRIIKPREIRSILLHHPSPEMTGYVKKYKNNNGVASVFGVIGGAGVGYSLGSAIGGGKINAGVLGAGAGAVLIGFLFDGIAKKNLKLAVNNYNNQPNLINSPTTF